VDIENATSDSVTKDYVISTSPMAGEQMSSGSTVYVTVSTGPQTSYVRMPNVIGLSEDAAISRLETAGLSYGGSDRVNSDVDAGTVIGQSADAFTEVEEHSKIFLKISLGPLESASGAGIFEGLFGAALRRKFQDPGPDCLAVAFLQFKFRAQSGRGDPAEDTCPVSELHLFPGHYTETAVRHEHAHRAHDLLHLPAIGSGIHDKAAAHGARDPRRELKSRQAMIPGGNRDSLQRRAGARGHPVALYTDFIQRRRVLLQRICVRRTPCRLPGLRKIIRSIRSIRAHGSDDHAPVAAVSDQQVCSLSQNEKVLTESPEQGQEFCHLPFRPHKDQRVRRISGSERTMPVHGLIISNSTDWKNLLYLFL
jgi:hypothetical protein